MCCASILETVTEKGYPNASSIAHRRWHLEIPWLDPRMSPSSEHLSHFAYCGVDAVIDVEEDVLALEALGDLVTGNQPTAARQGPITRWVASQATARGRPAAINSVIGRLWNPRIGMPRHLLN